MFFSKNSNTKEKGPNRIFGNPERVELGHLALLEENLLCIQDNGSRTATCHCPTGRGDPFLQP